MLPFKLRNIIKRCLTKEFRRFKHGGPVAFLFPGQGSQFLGMCKRFSQDRKIFSKDEELKSFFDKAREVLGFDLLKICLDGPAEKLLRTENCQLAVVVASLAGLEWQRKHRSPHLEQQFQSNDLCAAGFSVGEYSALVFGKSISLEDALTVVSARAKAMQQASEENPSGMVTVKGLLDYEVEELCQAAREWASHQHPKDRDPVAVIANYMYPRCKVVAGSLDALEYVLSYGQSKHGATEVSQLPVSGAFHSPLMLSAQPLLYQALERITVHSPAIPVYSGVTGLPYGSPEEIKRLLVQQLVHPIKWQHLITTLINDQHPGVFYEVGPGRQLTTTLCRIDRKYKRRFHNIEA